MNKIRSTILGAFLLGATLFLTPKSAEAQIVFGTGADYSYFVLEIPSVLTPLVFQWHYTYDALNPLTSIDLMNAVDLYSTDITFNYGFGGAYLESVDYLTIPYIGGFGSPGSPTWAQWVSGGESGYPAVVPIPSGAWIEGSGINSRNLTPGSWDGFIFNGEYDQTTYAVISAPPSIAPVPEPSSALLLGLASLTIAVLRRREHATAGV